MENNYYATILNLKRHSLEHDGASVSKDIHMLIENFKGKFEKEATKRFYELIEEKNFLACFMLFAHKLTRPLFYDEERMKTCCIHHKDIGERKDGRSVFPISIPQWILSDEKDLNTKLEMLNKLLEISMYKACLHKLLGVNLTQFHVESGCEEYEVEKSSSKFMLLPIGNYDYKHVTPHAPLLPLFNGETHSEIILSDNLPDNEAHNEYNGNLAYYGMPILNGLKVTNKGSSAVNIYYMPVYEKRS